MHVRTRPLQSRKSTTNASCNNKFFSANKSSNTYRWSSSALPPHLCVIRARAQLRQMRINELGNKISDWEVKLKQQQQLYESVRSDRNLYSKNLIEAQDEIAEMKRKLKIMNHQIEQLKEDITAKVVAPPKCWVIARIDRMDE